MNNIIEVAEKSEEIKAGPPVVCSCGIQYFSPFDKLYVSAYDKCSMCSDDDDLERLSGNIFALL